MQLYESERTANELLKKQVNQLENDLAKSKSDLELAKIRQFDRGHERHFSILVTDFAVLVFLLELNCVHKLFPNRCNFK